MKAERGFWLTLFTGAAAFFAFARPAILDPRYDAWLLSHPDTATAYLGWAFFRQAPFAQWPLGANPAYGLQTGSSVVFSDSIPLLALTFKPLAGALPAPFQYLGAWLLLCFVLQAGMAYVLLRRFVPEWQAWAGAAFFLVAPAWIFRFNGHFALCAQWIVLAALALYFAPRSRPGRWVMLLCAAALIHFYLLVMAAAIWLADLWQRRAPLGHLVLGATATLFAMWLAGYFMIGAAGSALPGFGTYRMNLLSVVDAEGLWSRVLPDVPSGYGDFEGFNYLGLGALLLLPLAAYSMKDARMDWRRGAPLLVASLLLTLIAASNRVALGSLELFSYDIPGLLQPGADLLRGSGRLFWPVYYLILTALLVLAFRALSPRLAVGAAVLLVAVQAADISPAVGQIRERLGGASWRSPLQAPVWSEIGKHYRRVAYVLPPPPSTAYASFRPWAHFAAANGMAINFGYFARIDAEKAIEASLELEAAVRANRLEPDTLYVFGTDALWELASRQRAPGDFVGTPDGFRVIAPGLLQGR